jgi:hypothetical protein
MIRSRFDRFNACPDCFYWKVKQYLSRRKENLRRFKEVEIKNMDWEEIYSKSIEDIESEVVKDEWSEITRDPMGYAVDLWYDYLNWLEPPYDECDYY